MANIFSQFMQPVRSVTDRMADFDAQDLRREQLSGMQQQNALQALAMQRQISSDEASRRQSEMMQRLAQEAGGDENKLVGLLRQAGMYDKAGQIDESLNKRLKLIAETGQANSASRASETKADKDRLQMVRDNAQSVADLMGTVKDQPSYMMAIQAAASRGVDVSALPQQYDPEYVKQTAAMAMSAVQRAEQEWKAKNYGLDVQRVQESARHNKAQEGLTVRGQNMSDARARQGLDLQREAARSVVVETSEGPALLDKGTGKTAILTGPDGKPLGPKLKDAPAAVQKAMIENGTNLRRAEQALALVQGKDVGEAKGDTAATGLKGYLPNQLLNRIDPLGVDARAQIADLGSLVIHDRSGAAVTAAEFPRLAPFIPSEKDDAGTVNKKLKRFVQVYKDEMAATQQAYGPESGYRQLGGAKPAADVAPKPAAAPAKPGAVLRFDANGKPVN